MTGQAPTNPNTQSPLTILLIDDDPDYRNMVRDALSIGQIPCRLIEADSGDRALQLLLGDGARGGEILPDVIYLDIGMPGMSGHDVLEILKGHRRLRHIPVVMLSGYEGSEHRERAINNGAAGFIAKGGGPRDLARSIARTLQASGGVQI